MKLRNKETGGVGKLLKLHDGDDEIEVITADKVYVYHSLAELNEKWEDYKEPEVLGVFPDEKKEAIKAFLTANGLNSENVGRTVKFVQTDKSPYFSIWFTKHSYGIDFKGELPKGIEKGKLYTLEELGLGGENE